jgi:ACS family allantoate permease-like MFS transporter
MSSDQKHVETRVVATNAGTKSIDQAALFLADAEDFEPLNAEQEQRLKRKIDFILIPMVNHFPRKSL